MNWRGVRHRLVRTSVALTRGAALAANDSYIRVPGALATKELAEASKLALEAIGDHEGYHLFANLFVGKCRASDGNLNSVVLELSPEQRNYLHSLQGQSFGAPAILAELARVSEVTNRSTNT
jgi:hypothetical protein